MRNHRNSAATIGIRTRLARTSLRFCNLLKKRDLFFVRSMMYFGGDRCPCGLRKHMPVSCKPILGRTRESIARGSSPPKRQNELGKYLSPKLFPCVEPSLKTCRVFDRILRPQGKGSGFLRRSLASPQSHNMLVRRRLHRSRKPRRGCLSQLRGRVLFESGSEDYHLRSQTV
jgi:hypothetical protein